MTDGSSPAGSKGEIRWRRTAVWDLPTRLFHWVMAALFVVLWVTGDASWLEWHMVIGQVLLMMLIFRLAWGVVGSRHSRFADFVVGPRAARQHFLEVFHVAMRGPAGADHDAPHIGHTRLGGWMILTLLVLLLVQAVSGLFATDDIMTAGPLNHLVNDRTARIMTVTHQLLFNVLLALLALHIGAALFYLVRKRENLILPLITGRIWLPPQMADREPRFASYILAVALLVMAAAIVWGITSI